MIYPLLEQCVLTLLVVVVRAAVQRIYTYRRYVSCPVANKLQTRTCTYKRKLFCVLCFWIPLYGLRLVLCSIFVLLLIANLLFRRRFCCLTLSILYYSTAAAARASPVLSVILLFCYCLSLTAYHHVIILKTVPGSYFYHVRSYSSTTSQLRRAQTVKRQWLGN